MEDELSLLERIKRHDQQALAEVHDRYFDKLYHYLSYRLGRLLRQQPI